MTFCDIHQHVVFGVDDGAANLKDSQSMIKAAVKQGIRDIICTSHITPGHRHSLDIELYKRNFMVLREWIEQKGIEVVLHTGSEILYTAETPRLLEAGKIPTLDGTYNVLIEFIPNAPYVQLKRAASDIANAGFEPIFAHVERYQCLREDGNLEELKSEFGIRAQMNATTVLKQTGLFGGDAWVKKMLKNQVIDIVASDSHNTDTRSCRIREAYELLCKKYGTSYAALLCCDAPKSILAYEY